MSNMRLLVFAVFGFLLSGGLAFSLPARARRIPDTVRALARLSASSTPSTPLVSLQNETIMVGNQVLMSGLDLTLLGGQRLAVLGQNGCGKSMLAQHIGSVLTEEDSTKGPASSVVQRRIITRGELALGFNELKWLEHNRREHTGDFPITPETGAIGDGSVRGAAVYFISFESHRRLLHEEAIEFHESRFTVVHKRATPASFLFPELYPAGVSWESGAADGFGYVGYRPMRTRLAPLPVPFDSDASEPLLAPFEDAMQNEAAYIGRILKQFGLWHIRHRPIFQLSTGECRKLLIVDFLRRASQPRNNDEGKASILVLDEAFDGLDQASRKEMAAMLREAFVDSTMSGSSLPRQRLALIHVSASPRCIKKYIQGSQISTHYLLASTDYPQFGRSFVRSTHARSAARTAGKIRRGL